MTAVFIKERAVQSLNKKRLRTNWELLLANNQYSANILSTATKKHHESIIKVVHMTKFTSFKTIRYL